MKRFIVSVLVCLLLVNMAIFAAGGAQSGGDTKPSYPTRNITMICPWAAGGGTDAILRALSAALEKQLGVTVTVENRTGGAGAIGHAAIKNARPDGYTLGMTTFELNSLPQQGLIDFTYQDYDNLIRVNADAAALSVNAKAPYKTIKEFVDYCKANPGKVSIGNSAPGSVWHVAAGLLANHTGIDVKHVSFEGAAPAVTALAGGHIEAVAVSLAEVKSQLDAGNVKCLGIMDAKRSPLYPNIPTFKDDGYNIEYYVWRGIAAPKGIDPAIRDILAKALAEAMKDPGFLEQAKRLNLNVSYLPPAEFTAFLKQNFEDVTNTMKAIGLIK